MKNLKDMLEKLKVDDIKINAEFPIDGDRWDIVDFLKGKGFKKVSEFGYFDGHAIAKCFMVDTMSIYFADTSKREISNENPLFYIGKSGTGNFIYDVYGKEHDTFATIVENDKKKFLEELNKRFGW